LPSVIAVCTPVKSFRTLILGPDKSSSLFSLQ
jgi:hypothetical protein